MNIKAKEIAELLKILANEHRLLIFCALMEKPMTVTEISKFVPSISQSGLSQHLGLLKAHGILSSEKSGQNVTYAILDSRTIDIVNALRKHYCEKATK